MDDQSVLATSFVDSPGTIIGRRGGNNVRSIELEYDLMFVLLNNALFVICCEVGPIGVDSVGIPCLSGPVSRSGARTVHLLRLIDPRQRSLGARNAGAVVVSAPEDKRTSVIETGFKISSKSLTAP